MNTFLHRSTTGEMIGLGAVAMIGRSPECRVVVVDPRIPRRHAMIRGQDGGFYLFDLGSFNGG